MTAHPTDGTPVLSRGLVERVLARLGLRDRPSCDLAGLTLIYSAVSRTISNDNIQKRIWLAGDRSTPVTGGEPTEFFENWLTHGTGGTCFPINGAFAALLEALGFQVRRFTSTMMAPGATRGVSNHGSVAVQLDDIDYFVDAQRSGFEPLPLVPGEETRTRAGIHTMRAVPIEDGHEIRFWAGHMREHEFRCQTEPGNEHVDHALFLELYDRSANVEGFSPFNHRLCISRHFDDSILTINRGRRVDVSSDGSVTSSEIDDETARTVLVEELGISEEAAAALPKGDPDGDPSFR